MTPNVLLTSLRWSPFVFWAIEVEQRQEMEREMLQFCVVVVAFAKATGVAGGVPERLRGAPMPILRSEAEHSSWQKLRCMCVCGKRFPRSKSLLPSAPPTLPSALLFTTMPRRVPQGGRNTHGTSASNRLISPNAAGGRSRRRTRELSTPTAR